MKLRFKKVLKISTIIIAILIGYALICTYTTFRIPCIFTKTTGLSCPGCGMTGMCLSILRFNFVSAFHFNPVIFIMLPFAGILTLWYIIYYIKTGNGIPRWLNIICYITIGILIIYGVARNLTPLL